MYINVFSEGHPCHGKSCNECETCIFDEPITDNSVRILPCCNKCEYLIKNYITGFVFNASCAKHLISTDNIERPRIIQRNVSGINADIYRPDWCPKINAGQKQVLSLPAPSKAATYDEYIEKRNKMVELPSVMDWKEIKEGDICVVPKLLRSERKVLLVKGRDEYVLKCVELNENLEPTSTFTNIYSNDIDVHFIVKMHKF